MFFTIREAVDEAVAVAEVLEEVDCNCVALTLVGFTEVLGMLETEPINNDVADDVASVPFID